MGVTTVTNYIVFLLAITEKEIKVRYKNAILGFLWIFLNPLLQMLIIGVIFNNFIHLPTGNYYLFTFIGLVPWNFISYSLTKATPIFVFERDLIQKAKFPREAIPLSIVFSNFFHFFITIILLVIFLLLFSQTTLISLINSLHLLVIACLWLLLLACGLSLTFSALNVKYRDINFLVQAVTLLWFYFTPVIYPVDMLPISISSLLRFNPLVYPLALLRSALLNLPAPSSSYLPISLLMLFAIVASGIYIFSKENKEFSDWL